MERPMVGHSGSVMGLAFAGPGETLVDRRAGRHQRGLRPQRATHADRGARGRPGPPRGRSAPAVGRGVYLDLLERDPNTAYVTDLTTGTNTGRLDHDLAGHLAGWDPTAVHQVTAVSITPDGSTALVGLEVYIPESGPVEDAGFVVVFDAETQQQRAVVPMPGRCTASPWLPTVAVWW